MKIRLAFILSAAVVFFPAASFFASGSSTEKKTEAPPSDKTASLDTDKTFGLSSPGPLYAYETDENDGSESLNRIAGTIDRGFSSPEQSFKSADQYKPGPFAREGSAAKQDQSDY